MARRWHGSSHGSTGRVGSGATGAEQARQRYGTAAVGVVAKGTVAKAMRPVAVAAAPQRHAVLSMARHSRRARDMTCVYSHASATSTASNMRTSSSVEMPLSCTNLSTTSRRTGCATASRSATSR